MGIFLSVALENQTTIRRGEWFRESHKFPTHPSVVYMGAQPPSPLSTPLPISANWNLFARMLISRVGQGQRRPTVDCNPFDFCGYGFKGWWEKKGDGEWSIRSESRNCTWRTPPRHIVVKVTQVYFKHWEYEKIRFFNWGWFCVDPPLNSTDPTPLIHPMSTSHSHSYNTSGKVWGPTSSEY